MKKLFNSKLSPVFSMGVILVFCISIFFLSSHFLGSNPPAATPSAYAIGELVLDTGGSTWRYEGNFVVEIGQVTKDMKLLSIIINGKESKILWIAEELIPKGQLGDVFKLVQASDDLAAEYHARGPSEPRVKPRFKNVIVADPPVFVPDLAGGGLCCMKIPDD